MISTAWAEEARVDKTHTAYLFSYFLGNGEDGLHLAASRDGLHWTPLGGGRSWLKPQLGRETLMRDPSIVRGPDGTFHMVWTTSWNDRVIGYAHSKNLMHWSKQRAIGVMAHEPEARNCWAPELFYDEPSAHYLILWSTTIPGRFAASKESSEDKYNHRVYFTATQDFERFAPTKLYFDPGHSVIDAFLARAGKKYLLFYKDETRFPEPRKTLHLAVAEGPEGPFAPTLNRSSPATGSKDLQRFRSAGHGTSISTATRSTATVQRSRGISCSGRTSATKCIFLPAHATAPQWRSIAQSSIPWKREAMIDVCRITGRVVLVTRRKPDERHSDRRNAEASGVDRLPGRF